MENIDQIGIQLLTRSFRISNRDHIACEGVFLEAEPDQLFELFNPGSASSFIVVAMKAEADAKVPTQPNTTEDRTEYSAKKDWDQLPPTCPADPPFIGGKRGEADRGIESVRQKNQVPS